MTELVAQLNSDETHRDTRKPQRGPEGAEVAKMLGVTPQHIYKMAKAGLIPCFNVRGAVRFFPADFAEWIKQEIVESSRKRNGSSGGNGMKYGT